MKKIALILLIFFSACSTQVILRRAPSDLVLLSVQPNNKTDVFYAFRSELSDPFRYNNRSTHAFEFDLNGSYASNLRTYMGMKFSKLRDRLFLADSCTVLEFTLKAVFFNYGRNQSTIEQLSAAFGNPERGDAVLSVEIHTTVKVLRGGKPIGQKAIVATANSDAPLTSNMGSLFASTMNDGISKSMIMIDKYLVSIGF